MYFNIEINHWKNYLLLELIWYTLEQQLPNEHYLFMLYDIWLDHIINISKYHSLASEVTFPRVTGLSRTLFRKMLIESNDINFTAVTSRPPKKQLIEFCIIRMLNYNINTVHLTLKEIQLKLAQVSIQEWAFKHDAIYLANDGLNILRLKVKASQKKRPKSICNSIRYKFRSRS